jgi:hypothetical protein
MTSFAQMSVNVFYDWDVRLLSDVRLLLKGIGHPEDDEKAKEHSFIVNNRVDWIFSQ